MKIKTGEIGSERFKVLLNGRPLEHVIEADDEEGYAICHARNWRGETVVFDATGEIVTEYHYGKIEIESNHLVEILMSAGRDPVKPSWMCWSMAD